MSKLPIKHLKFNNKYNAIKLTQTYILKNLI